MELRWGEEKTMRGRGVVAAKLQMPVSEWFKSLEVVQVHDASYADSQSFDEPPTLSTGGASKTFKFCSACGQRQEATHKFCLACGKMSVSV